MAAGAGACGPRPSECGRTALEGHLVLGPRPLDHLQRFLQASGAVALANAERLELDVPVADADPKEDASTAQHIERGQLLGDIHGVEQRQQEDSGQQAHVAAFRGQPGQQRDRLQLLALGEEVLPDAHR
jgi:hypothetical protein